MSLSHFLIAGRDRIGRPLLTKRYREAPAHRAVQRAPDIDCRAIYRHLEATTNGVWAWFALGDVFWGYRSQEDRAAILDSVAQRYVELVGHRVHLRVTAQPVPWEQWAEDYFEAHPGHLPDVEGAESFVDYLAASQEAVAHRPNGPSETAAAFIGVRFCTTLVPKQDLSKLLSPEPLTARYAGLEPHRQALRRVTEVVAREGLGATELSPRSFAWLMHKSRTLGIAPAVNAAFAPKDGWGEGDMDAFSAPIDISAAPWADHVTVRVNRDGEQHTSHVAVLSVEFFNDELDPTSMGAPLPWMAFAKRLDLPLEWSAIFDVVAGTEAVSDATWERRRMENQVKEVLESNEMVPPEVEEALHEAIRVEKECKSIHPTLSARCIGTFRIAVSERTLQALDTRCKQVISLYAEAQHITLQRDAAQYATYNEFTPGQAPFRSRTRTMPAYYAATAVPNYAAGVGQDTGAYLARVIGGGNGSLFHDALWGPHHNQSGVQCIWGAQGAGKSFLLGSLAEASARAGHKVVLFDPAGNLSQLLKLPHLVPHSQLIDLAKAAPGTLNPYVLVPDPRPEEYAPDVEGSEEYERACVDADDERRELMIEVAMMMQQVSTDTAVEERGEAIRQAADDAPAHYGASPWGLVEHLLELDTPVGTRTAKALEVAANAKGTRLIFPPRAGRVRVQDLTDQPVTVFALTGVDAPPKELPRSAWTASHRRAALVMHLGARYALRVLYTHPGPKFVGVDELGIAGAGETAFVPFLLRTSVDSRKREAAVVLSMQNSSMIRVVGDQFGNLVGSAWVGKSSKESTVEAFGMLGIPAGMGYEHIPRTLPAGQFLRIDWSRDETGAHRPVERVLIDQSRRPHLVAALDTTPQAVARTPKAVKPKEAPEGRTW